MSGPDFEPIRPEDLRTFLAVVRQCSFTDAARELGLPRPTVSRHIARLEEQLGVRLLDRTTRRVAATPAGEEVARHAREALFALDQVARSAQVALGTPRGLLRIAAPPIMGPLLCGHIIHEMLAEFPDLAVEMDLRDRRVDVARERYDVALRMGSIADDDLVAIPLGQVSLWVVGAPSMKGAGPREFDGALLSFSQRDWPFMQGEARYVVRPSQRLRVNDYGLIARAAARGMGPALLPSPMCRPAMLAERGLIRLAADWHLPSQPVYLLRPAGRLVTPRVRAFIDRIKARSASPEWPLAVSTG